MLLSVEVQAVVVEAKAGKRNATYTCRVHVTGGRPAWTVSRRYRQWDELCAALDSEGRAEPPPLPGKKLFGQLDPTFLERRRRDLQAWASDVVGTDSFRDSDLLWQWLQPGPGDEQPSLLAGTPGSLPVELMVNADENFLKETLPMMQGNLLLVDPTGRHQRWFELRGAILVWFDGRDGTQLGGIDLQPAVVATSAIMQELSHGHNDASR